MTDTDDLHRNDPRLDTLLLAACRERGIHSAEDLRRELRSEVARQLQPDTMITRIEAALAARPNIDGRLVEFWRDADARYGIDSGPARGALLDLVRETWNDPNMYIGRFGVGWCSYSPEPGWVSAAGLYHPSELDALVAALEASPP